MRWITALALTALLLAAGCGDDDGDEQTAAPPETTTQAAPPATTEAEREPENPDGTEIVLRDSEFGPMLFDSKKQAIYIFERDSKNETNCYDDCATAWPPVYTDGEPVAGRGVQQSLLGTIERRDGKRQVTYAGQPLYFYDHEGPGEVRCHNVNLNGGLWWVVGADGKRRP